MVSLKITVVKANRKQSMNKFQTIRTYKIQNHPIMKLDIVPESYGYNERGMKYRLHFVGHPTNVIWQVNYGTIAECEKEAMRMLKNVVLSPTALGHIYREYYGIRLY